MIKTGAKLVIEKTASRWQDLIERKDGEAIAKIAAFSPILLEPDRYLYVRARAVSGLERHGPNDNEDGFRWGQLLNRYPTFVSDPVNLDHINESIDKAIGWIANAIPVHQEEYIQILMAVNRKAANRRYPGLVGMDPSEKGLIELAKITDVSMGCYVDYSVCSVCGHKAETPLDYCEHIAERKGKKIKMSAKDLRKVMEEGSIKEAELPWIIPDEYERQAVLSKSASDYVMARAFEINENPTFFEESIITTCGADRDAKMVEVLASKESDWRQVIVERKPNNLKEGLVMEAKQAAEKANPIVTMKDSGDYGSSSKLNETISEQAKGKSTATDSKGSPVVTQKDPGDYVLARKDGSILVSGGKKDILRTILSFEENPPTPDSTKNPDEAAGGKPPVVEKAEIARDIQKMEEVKDRVPNEVKEKIEDKQEEKEHKLTSSIVSVFNKMLDLTKKATVTPLQGNDKGDYGTSKEKDTQTKDVADSSANETRSDIDKQKKVDFTTYEGREKMKSVSSKAAEAVQYIVSQMQTGKSFEEAKMEASEKYKETDEKPQKDVESKQQRIEGRKKAINKISEEIGQDGKKNSEETQKVSEEASKLQEEKLKDETKGNTTPETKGGKQAAADPTEEAKKVVEKLDGIAENIEDKVEKKKQQAALFARTSMVIEAEKVVKKIDTLVSTIAHLDKVSNNIEQVVDDIQKASEASKPTLLAKLSTLVTEAKDEADKQEEEIKKEEEKDKEDQKKEKEASSLEKVSKENVSLKKQCSLLREAQVKQAKGKLVSAIVRDMVEKGLISVAETPKKTAELMALSEEALGQFNKTISPLPKVSNIQGSKSVREALRGLENLQVPIIQKASVGKGVGEDGGFLEKGEMFE